MPQVQPSPFTESKDNMAITYEKIATTTLGSNSASISLGSIPSTYTDLKIVANLIPDGGAIFEVYPTLRLNSTTTAYSQTVLQGNGSAAASSRRTNESRIYLTGNSYPLLEPCLVNIDIFSYAGSTFKTCLVSGNVDKNGSGSVAAIVGLWRNTDAITSISIDDGGAAVGFKTGTTISIYGILKA